MVQVSGEANQCEAMRLSLLMKGKQRSSGDGRVESVISVEAASEMSSASGTKHDGFEARYWQASPRNLQRRHCGTCFPHFLRALAQLVQALHSGLATMLSSLDVESIFRWRDGGVGYG